MFSSRFPQLRGGGRSTRALRIAAAVEGEDPDRQSGLSPDLGEETIDPWAAEQGSKPRVELCIGLAHLLPVTGLGGILHALDRVPQRLELTLVRQVTLLQGGELEHPAHSI